MSTLPIHSMGGLLRSEIELLVVEKSDDLKAGYATMLENKLAEHKKALDERLDLQDGQIADVKGIVTESNTSIKQLCEKHEGWHDGDILWRNNVKDEIASLKSQVRAIRVFIAICNGVVKSARYLFEHGDKATGLTLKVILAGIVYLCGQNVYFHWLAPLINMWLKKGH